VHESAPFDQVNFSALGNDTSCKIQAISATTGGQFTLYSNITLNIFYVCTITFGMTEKTVKRRMLPIALLIFSSLVIMFIVKSISFAQPQMFPPMCSFVPIFADVQAPTVRFFAMLPLLSILVLVVSMIIIVVSVCCRKDLSRSTAAPPTNCFTETASDASVIENNNNANERECEDGTRNDENENELFAVHHKHEMKILRQSILLQALMYLGAFILTWWWVFAALILRALGRPVPYSFQILTAIFLPLQGFFNALIFISHKVQFLRKYRNELTSFAALKLVLLSPWVVPEVLFSGIELVVVHGPQNIDNEDIAEDAQPSFSLPSDLSSSLYPNS